MLFRSQSTCSRLLVPGSIGIRQHARPIACSIIYHIISTVSHPDHGELEGRWMGVFWHVYIDPQDYIVTLKEMELEVHTTVVFFSREQLQFHLCSVRILSKYCTICSQIFIRRNCKPFWERSIVIREW